MISPEKYSCFTNTVCGLVFRAKLLRHFEALNEHIMRRERRVEWRLKRLQLSHRRERFLADDSNRLKEIAASPVTEHTEVHAETQGEVPEVRAETQEEVSEIPESSVGGVPTGKLLDLSNSSSEPQRNEMLEIKKKILKEEFGFDIEESNRVVDTSLTDYFSCLESAKDATVQAGVNKRKMMESESGVTLTSQTNQKVATAKQESGSFVGSDYFSCLESAKEAIAQANVNRRKMMESEFGTIPISQTVEEVATTEREDCTPVLGESAVQAAINKRKMMETEFGIAFLQPARKGVAQGGTEAGEEAEKNRVTMMKSSCFAPCNSQMSDLEKNRRRVLQEEFQLEVTDKSLSETKKSSDEKMSDPQRNKQRVMGEELDILTGAPRRRHVRISEQPTQESSSEAIEDEIETGEKITGPVSSDSGLVSVATVAERPKDLQLTSELTGNEPIKKSRSIEDRLSYTR